MYIDFETSFGSYRFQAANVPELLNAIHAAMPTNSDNAMTYIFQAAKVLNASDILKDYNADSKAAKLAEIIHADNVHHALVNTCYDVFEFSANAAAGVTLKSKRSAMFSFSAVNTAYKKERGIQLFSSHSIKLAEAELIRCARHDSNRDALAAFDRAASLLGYDVRFDNAEVNGRKNTKNRGLVNALVNASVKGNTLQDNEKNGAAMLTILFAAIAGKLAGRKGDSLITYISNAKNDKILAEAAAIEKEAASLAEAAANLQQVRERAIAEAERKNAEAAESKVEAEAERKAAAEKRKENKRKAERKAAKIAAEAEAERKAAEAERILNAINAEAAERFDATRKETVKLAEEAAAEAEAEVKRNFHWMIAYNGMTVKEHNRVNCKHHSKARKTA